MIAFIACLILAQEMNSTWEQTMQASLFPQSKEWTSIRHLSSEEGQNKNLVIVADGLSIDHSLRLFILSDSLILGVLDSMEPAFKVEVDKWSLMPENSENTEGSFCFDEVQQLELKNFSTKEEMINALGKNEIHGWVLPDAIDRVMKFQTKKKTLHQCHYQEHFFWWAENANLNSDSSLKWELKSVIEKVDHFQNDKKFRTDFFNKTIKPLKFSKKNRVLIWDALSVSLFFSPSAEPHEMIQSELKLTLDSRWFHYAKRLIPQLPSEKLGFTIN